MKIVDIQDRRVPVYSGLERRVGTYVVCKYTPQTISELEAWAKKFEIPDLLESHKMHTTVIYSRKYISKLHCDLLEGRQLLFKPKGFQLFDSRGPRRKPGTKALVLLLKAPELEELHVQARVLGATHDHYDYHPHVTLTYDCSADFSLSQLTLPVMTLHADRLYGEDLDLSKIPK